MDGQPPIATPFAPPEFAHPEEFVPPVPRPLPTCIRRGPYRTRKRLYLLGLVLLECVIVGVLANFEAFRFLPDKVFALGMMLGFAIPLGLVGAFLHMTTTADRTDYVVRGEPLVARVLSVSEICNGDPQEPRWGYALDVEVHDPATGKVSREKVDSGFFAGEKSFRRECACVAASGDFITVVRHKDRFDYPLAAYGFTLLNKRHDLVRVGGQPRGAAAEVLKVMEFAALFALLGAILMVLHRQL